MSFLRRLFALDFSVHDDEKEYTLKDFRKGLYHLLFRNPHIQLVRKINSDVNSDIIALKKHIIAYNKKISIVKEFLNGPSNKILDRLHKSIDEIYKIFDIEKQDDEKEVKYVLKAIKTIDNISEFEENITMLGDEMDMRHELIELKKQIETLEPVLIRQINFFTEPIDVQKQKIKSLLFDIHEEGVILGYEEKTLKKLHNDIQKAEIDIIIE